MKPPFERLLTPHISHKEGFCHRWVESQAAAHAGGEDGDVGLGEVGFGGGDALAEVGEGEFGRVVGAAEVREPEPAHAVCAPGAQDGVRRLVVGEVAAGAEDALFERLRVGAAQQTLAVMVRFDDQQVGLTDGCEHSVRHFAAVDDDADAAAPGAEQVATRRDGIMRNGK